MLDAERNLAGRHLQPLGPAGPEPQQQHRVRATARPICPATQLWPHSPTGCKAQVWRTQFSRASFEVNSSSRQDDLPVSDIKYELVGECVTSAI